MRKQTVKISIEIEVDVEGNYSPPSNGSWEQPPEYAEFEINKVLWQGIDIADMLEKENYDFTEIEEQCLEQIENER
jgi:hypothetical protein